MTTASPERALGVWSGLGRYLRRSMGAYLRSDAGTLQEERRRLALQLLRDDAEFITFRRDGLLWTASVRDTGVAKYLFSQGAYHGGEIQNLLAWLSSQGVRWTPDSYVIDVGANIGTTSLPIAQTTGANVLAIEPIPGNLELLRQNVAQNGMASRIRCVQAAIAPERGSMEMLVSRRNSGGSELKRHDGRQGFGERTSEHHVVNVSTLPLQELVHEQGIAAENVALVWSDTQGAETGVIASGAKLWSAGVCLFVEIWPRGLDAHGGRPAFLETATRHFARFLGEDDLRTSRAPRPIAELKQVCSSLTDAEFTNVLLLPPHGRWTNDAVS